MQDFRMRCLVLLAMVVFVSVMAGCGNRSNNALVAPVHPVTTQNATLNPVLNFYINRSVYTDTTPYTLLGYGVDTVGDYDT